MNKLSASICLALASMALSGNALAQRAALVQDRDAPGRAPYQAEMGMNPSGATCPNQFFCVFTFPAVPAGQRLVITQAAVEFTNGIASPGVGYVSGPGGIFGPRMIIPPGTVTASNRTIASGPVTYYLEAGQTPTVIMSGNNVVTNNSAFAMLSGYFVSTAP